MQNIEIKAIYKNLARAKEIAQSLMTDYVGVLHQVDTYFNTQNGRIKLREINGEKSELIPYYKHYGHGPMQSNYSVLPTDEPEKLKDILNYTLGTFAVVDKTREVYLIDNIRIHLDQVKDLGEFIEFEAVYDDSDPKNKDIEIAKVKELMQKFEINDDMLLDKSYIDYLLAKKGIDESYSLT
jgi:adenylate cyclase class 2